MPTHTVIGSFRPTHIPSFMPTQTSPLVLSCPHTYSFFHPTHAVIGSFMPERTFLLSSPHTPLPACLTHTPLPACATNTNRFQHASHTLRFQHASRTWSKILCSTKRCGELGGVSVPNDGRILIVVGFARICPRNLWPSSAVVQGNQARWISPPQSKRCIS